MLFFFFSSRRRHTRLQGDWSSDVCSSDLAKTAVRRKSSTRMLNGIPLKRRMVWVYDLDSPEYKARRKKDLNEIRRRDADRDGMQFVEAVLADPDVQKWWK